MNVISKNLILGVLLVTGSVFSSEDTRVNVSFEKPERFTDFKSQANPRDKDRERLMQQLTELMIESAHRKIANDQKMNITINNIDMAGTFLYGDSDLYRVVRDADRVLIEFSYELFDANDKLIKKDEVNLTSRHNKLNKRADKKYQHTHFTYEMPLFDEWLNNL